MNLVAEVVNSYQASYCCGGIIPMINAQIASVPKEDDFDSPTIDNPIALCWDIPGESGYSKKISFPLMLSSASSTARVVLSDELLKACAPAISGL